MKKLLKKTACFLLACVLFAGMAIATPVTAKAADSKYTDLYLSDGLESAIANTAKEFTFQIPTTGPLYIDVYFRAPTAFSYTLTPASNGKAVDSGTIAEDHPYWNKGENYYVNGPAFKSAAVGTYNLSITTEADAQYIVNVYQGKPTAAISNTSISITEGFTHKLSVSKATGTIKWKSGNTKIATVSSKGVVTAKKAGSCTITAVTADGQSLKCKVKVIKNVYTAAKAINSDADDNKVTAYVYSASFDAKGNLVCRLRVINNTLNAVQKLSNTTINVNNSSGKTVYSYKVNEKAVTVPSGSYAGCTITIPKSNVKKCDLVKGEILVAGHYVYR